MQRKVLVLGTARSGTSLACGVVDCLGVRMLTSKPKPHQLRHNPKGMYELRGLMGFGKRLNEEAERTESVAEAAENLREHVNKTLLQHVPEGDWGIKTPTIHRGLDVLLHYMPECHVLCLFRNLIDHAKSFQMFRLKNDGVKTPLSHLVEEMAQHNLTIAQRAAELKQKGHPVQFITYEGLKHDPLKESQRIAEFLGIDSTDEMKQKVLDFVEPNLHTWKDEGLETLPVEINQ